MRLKFLAGIATITVAIQVQALSWTDESTGRTWTYSVQNVEVEIAGVSPKTGDLNIPSEINGNPVTGIRDFAFDGYNKLKSVTIPEGMMRIGGWAFRRCSGLSEVTIPSSVTNVGNWAFYLCGGMTRILVEEANAHYCSVDGILYDKSISELIYCPQNKDGAVAIVQGVKSVRRDAFYGCARLSGVTISSGVADIGVNAFLGCSNLVEIVIPNGVENIGSTAFAHCTGLSSVAIPASVRQIGDKAFYGCESLGQGIVVVDGCVLLVNGECPSAVKFSDDVRLIVGGIFQNHEEIISVTWPEKVTSIGGQTFDGCVNLSAVTMPEGVTNIGEWAFAGCNALTEITIPKNVEDIGKAAFSSCAELKSITIPSTVRNIGPDAIAYCYKLEIVVTDYGDSERIKGMLDPWTSGLVFVERDPPHIVKFDLAGYGTRVGGGELEQRINHGDAAEAPIVQANYGWEFDGWNCDFSIVTNGLNVVAQWSRQALRAKVGNETWTFYAEGDGVVIGNAGKVAVAGNTNGSLMIPEQLDGKTVVGLDEYALAGLDGLRSVVIPSSVVSIGNGAFAGCVGLDTIKVATGDTDRVGRLVVDSGLDVSWVEFREKNTGTGAGGSTDTVCLTITNVVVNYIVNSIQPSFVRPATYDTGFVNIIAEVKGGCVAVPATWTVNYPKFTEKFGSDFTKALAMQTGKKDGAGNPMFVWQDYVAGTDPTDETNVFTASITIVDGKVKVSYSPELDDARKALRKYTTWGKVKLTDKDWSVVGEGEEGNFNFFKVTVEMR